MIRNLVGVDAAQSMGQSHGEGEADRHRFAVAHLVDVARDRPGL